MVAIYFSIRVQRKFSFGTKWIIFYDVEITRINDTLTQFSGKPIFRKMYHYHKGKIFENSKNLLNEVVIIFLFFSFQCGWTIMCSNFDCWTLSICRFCHLDGFLYARGKEIVVKEEYRRCQICLTQKKDE